MNHLEDAKQRPDVQGRQHGACIANTVLIIDHLIDYFDSHWSLQYISIYFNIFQYISIYFNIFQYISIYFNCLEVFGFESQQNSCWLCLYRICLCHPLPRWYWSFGLKMNGNWMHGYYAWKSTEFSCVFTGSHWKNGSEKHDLSLIICDEIEVRALNQDRLFDSLCFPNFPAEVPSDSSWRGRSKKQASRQAGHASATATQISKECLCVHAFNLHQDTEMQDAGGI